MYRNQLTTDESTDLELLIDRCGLNTVLAAIAVICEGKREHLISNWQDHAQAKTWCTDGTKVLRVSDQVTNR